MNRPIQFLPRIFKHKGAPIQLIFFITSRCNLRCEHCFYLDELNKTHGELTLDEIKKMADGMDPLLWISLTGGEPFLRRDIADIVEIFYKGPGFYLLTISTNGSQHQAIKTTVTDMCRRCPDAKFIVSVSIDGLEATHDRIRGAIGSFEKAVKCVQMLKEMKGELPNLNVSTITTINADNQTEMEALALHLRDVVRPDSMTLNMIRGKPKDGPLGQVDVKNYKAFIEIQKQGWESKDLGYYNLATRSILKKRELRQKEIIASVAENNKYVIPCLAGNISCMMTETGDLYPCEILDKKFGNIRDAGYDFNKLWYSAHGNEIRSFIKDTNCFCTYECALTTNVLFNFKELMKMPFRR